MDRRPEYLPAAVWRFYRELADKYPEDQPERARLAGRLFGTDRQSRERANLDGRKEPAIALTWRALARQIETAPVDPLREEQATRWRDDQPLRQALAEQDWRHLLDLLLQLPHTYTPEAREALRRADGLLSEIGEAAERLADLLREYSTIRERYQFTAPELFTMLSEWLKATTGEDEPGRYEPAPADMIESLALAAWSHTIDADAIDEAFIRDRKVSNITGWVRHFDALWARWQQDCCAARFEVSNTDLARIASAVLEMDISRETVKQARASQAPGRSGTIRPRRAARIVPRPRRPRRIGWPCQSQPIAGPSLMTNPSANLTPALMTERDAAAYLSLSHRTLQAWRLRGGGPQFIKLGANVRYDRGVLDRFIAERVRSNTAA